MTVSAQNRRRRAIVICPGRGTYNREQLGYLHAVHGDRMDALSRWDALRRRAGQVPLRELDGAEKYSAALHGAGDNASPLIYACARADFCAIDRSRFDIVAVTGNSMGWYIALACAGALSADHGFELVNTMGTLMHETAIGGQLLYPLVDEQWRPVPGRRQQIMAALERINGSTAPRLFVSIELGGYLLLAGTGEALAELAGALPSLQGRFPMILAGHSAFHTPLQQPVSDMAMQRLGPDMFRPPDLPLIDGRGGIWYPPVLDLEHFFAYTLRTQVVEPYDFTRAVQVAVKEFAPDCLIVTGPGNNLGAPVAQALVAMNWQGMGDRAAFQERQKSANPVLLSMGLPEQRPRAV